MATADIHSPVYVALWCSELAKQCSKAENLLLLIAGDVVDKGRAEAARLVETCLRKCGNKLEAVGVFGNDDYEEQRKRIAEILESVKWLDDDVAEIALEGATLRIFGTTGLLDELTTWQSRNAPWLKQKFEERLKKIEEFAREPKKEGEVRVLLTHYPPTYKTLEGEPKFAWPQMGSKRAEEAIAKGGGLDFVVHGHAHKSRVLEARIGTAVVLNVAFPALRTLKELGAPRQRSLLDFLGSAP